MLGRSGARRGSAQRECAEGARRGSTQREHAEGTRRGSSGLISGLTVGLITQPCVCMHVMCECVSDAFSIRTIPQKPLAEQNTQVGEAPFPLWVRSK
jgi:hypothetical protein